VQSYHERFWTDFVGPLVALDYIPEEVLPNSLYLGGAQDARDLKKAWSVNLMGLEITIGFKLSPGKW
jgi:hypothetical protein